MLSSIKEMGRLLLGNNIYLWSCTNRVVGNSICITDAYLNLAVPGCYLLRHKLYFTRLYTVVKLLAVKLKLRTKENECHGAFTKLAIL